MSSQGQLDDARVPRGLDQALTGLNAEFPVRWFDACHADGALRIAKPLAAKKLIGRRADAPRLGAPFHIGIESLASVIAGEIRQLICLKAAAVDRFVSDGAAGATNTVRITIGTGRAVRGVRDDAFAGFRVARSPEAALVDRRRALDRCTGYADSVLAELGATQVTGVAVGVVTAIAGHAQIDAGSGTAGDAVRAAAQFAARARDDRVSTAELGAGIEGNASTTRFARDTTGATAADGARRAARSACVAPVLHRAAQLFAVTDTEAAGAITALRIGRTAGRTAVGRSIGADTSKSVPRLNARTRDRIRGRGRTASSLAIRNGHAGGDCAPQAEQPAQDPPPIATGCQ